MSELGRKAITGPIAGAPARQRDGADTDLHHHRSRMPAPDPTSGPEMTTMVPRGLDDDSFGQERTALGAALVDQDMASLAGLERLTS